MSAKGAMSRDMERRVLWPEAGLFTGITVVYPDVYSNMQLQLAISRTEL